jgi:hypothetical protein
MAVVVRLIAERGFEPGGQERGGPHELRAANET